MWNACHLTYTHNKTRHKQATAARAVQTYIVTSASLVDAPSVDLVVVQDDSRRLPDSAPRRTPRLYFSAPRRSPPSPPTPDTGSADKRERRHSAEVPRGRARIDGHAVECAVQAGNMRRCLGKQRPPLPRRMLGARPRSSQGSAAANGLEGRAASHDVGLQRTVDGGGGIFSNPSNSRVTWWRSGARV